MKATLELTPDQGERLFEVARAAGVDLQPLLRDADTQMEAFLRARGTSAPNDTPSIDEENAAIAWLDQRMAEDATDDPKLIREAEEEVAEFRRNLNANRAATGERLVSR